MYTWYLMFTQLITLYRIMNLCDLIGLLIVLDR